MTKTNELLPNNTESQENFVALGNNFASHSPKSKRRWKHTQPDIQKQCFICDLKFPVKYNLPRQQYSQKNLWGYWTEKETDQKKYICNACLKKNLLGRFEDWGVSGEKSKIFHVYLSRNKFETTT